MHLLLSVFFLLAVGKTSVSNLEGFSLCPGRVDYHKAEKPLEWLTERLQGIRPNSPIKTGHRWRSRPRDSILIRQSELALNSYCRNSRTATIVTQFIHVA